MSAFDAVHSRLRELMIEAAPEETIAVDRPGELVMHTTAVHPGTGEPVWFGAVTVKKSYVAYHLFPLYSNPELDRDISAGLSRRRQGKSCFNFTKTDTDLFNELAELTRKAATESGQDHRSEVLKDQD